MPFMERQIVSGKWIEVEGEAGTEWIEADLVGEVEEYSGPAISVPESLADYTENRKVTEIKVIEGWGCRWSAPGYMDCTPWSVFETKEEAEEYLAEQEEDDE